MKKEKLFMAFAAGKETKETNFSRYIGVAPVQVLAINPAKSELDKIYGRDMKEPVYFKTIDTNNGEKLNMATVTFIVKPDFDKTGIDTTLQVNFNLFEDYRTNADNTKIEVIDEYGRTAWVTKTQLDNKEIPTYSNGPAKISRNYRPVLRGEEALLDFIKCWLGIPNIDIYNANTGTWTVNANPKDCEAYFSNPKAFFKGDFSEVKAITSSNLVKVLFGVQHSNDGKLYQTAFTEKFAKNNAGTNAIERVLKDRKEAGAYSAFEFEICPLKEYNVEATQFGNSTAAMPESNVKNWFD